jgi:hypothetical protein
MNRVLIARMNADAAAVDEFNAWYDGEHMAQASAIPGFGTDHRRYIAEAYEGKYWNYETHPEFTAVYALEADADRQAAIDSEPYAAWSGDFLARWRERTRDEVSIMCDQVFGREDPLPYERLLIAQMNVAPEHEDEFNRWYNDEHIPQAGGIPGFGTDHRRFRAIELEGRNWHYRPDPRYTAMYEMQAGADVLSAINSDEYRGWSGDFLARWRDRTSDEISTICRRIY